MEEDKKIEIEIDDKPKKHKNKDITKDPKYLALKEENEALKDQLLRRQAEFENFRKRTLEEKQKERKYALYDFLMDLIDSLDIYDKAVKCETDDEKLKNFLVGFKMINEKIRNVLADYGVKEIDCLNQPFDASLEEALSSVEVEGVEPGMVVEIVMTGYLYKDKILRPAKVKVSK